MTDGRTPDHHDEVARLLQRAETAERERDEAVAAVKVLRALVASLKEELRAVRELAKPSPAARAAAGIPEVTP